MIFRRRQRKYTPVAKGEVVRKLLEAAPVRVGSGSRAVIVFFDLKCPFCARMFKESEEVLMEMASRGMITFAMCDFVVHKDAEPLHRELRCVSDGDRLSYIAEVYSGKRKAADGQCNSQGHRECEKLAEELGVVGTPTVLVYDMQRDKGYMAFGYVAADELVEMLREL